MGIDTFEIDYNKLVVNKVKVKDTTLFYFDNFYKNPEKVLELYEKNTDQLIVKDNEKYPGSRINLVELIGKEYAYEHLEEVKKLLVSNGFDASKFVPNFGPDALSLSKLDMENIKTFKEEQLKNQGTITNPHTDGNPRIAPHSLIAGVCYLSKHVHGGTGLYYNKLLKTHRINRSFEIRDAERLWNKISKVGVEDIQQLGDIVEKHFIERSLKIIPKEASGTWTSKGNEYFELIHVFPMKFNRMIFYEGNLIHSIYIEDEEFYKINDRITANLWLPIKWDNVDRRDCPLSEEILEYLDELTIKFSNEREFRIL